MPYTQCSYIFCEHEVKGLIPEEDLVHCSKCGNKKVFHKDCFNNHNGEKHGGKATAKPLKKMPSMSPTGKRKV